MKTNFILTILYLGMTAFLLTDSATAQQKPTADYLKPTREIKDDEKCDEYVTGQFYFRICREVEETVTKHKIVMVDKTCVVYDPVKCCNVIVTKKVQEKRPFEETVLVPKEIVVCKQIQIRLDQIESLPDCPCSDWKFLKPAAAGAQLEPARGNAIAEHDREGSTTEVQISMKSASRVETGDRTVLVPIEWGTTGISRFDE